MNRGQMNKLKMITAVATLLSLSACSPTQNSSDNQTSDVNASGILGGTEVASTDPIASSTVGIVDLSSGGVICTGSLIDKNIVMTAAHCTFENPLQLAIMFSNRLPQGQEDANKTEVRRVIAGRTSPLWPAQRKGQSTNTGDIALLRFSGALPAGYSPAHLLADSTALQEGASVVISGFGLIEGKAGTKVLRQTSVKIASLKFSATEVVFDQRQGRGACHGDSGGPAFVMVNNKLVLFGITSRGIMDPTDSCMGLSVYTNASVYLSFIVKTINSLNKVTKLEKIPQPVRN